MYVHMRRYRILPSKTSCPSLPAGPRKAGRTFKGDGDSIIVLARLLRKCLSMMLVAFSAWRILLAQGEREEKRAGRRVPCAELSSRER